MPEKGPVIFSPIWVNPETKEVIGPSDLIHECPACGHPTPFPIYKEKHCPQCGSLQEAKRVPAPPPSKICAKCHTRNSAENNFCTECGSPLK
jgi:membrane protease subunit (stomatin/prohibitin family)